MTRLIPLLCLLGSMAQANNLSQLEIDIRSKCSDSINRRGGEITMGPNGDYYLVKSPELDTNYIPYGTVGERRIIGYFDMSLQNLLEGTPFPKLRFPNGVLGIAHEVIIGPNKRLKSYAETVIRGDESTIKQYFSATFEGDLCLVDTRYDLVTEMTHSELTIRNSRRICEEAKNPEADKKALFKKLLESVEPASLVQVRYFLDPSTEITEDGTPPLFTHDEKTTSASHGWVLRKTGYATLADVDSPAILDLVFAKDGALCPAHEFEEK